MNCEMIYFIRYNNKVRIKIASNSNATPRRQLCLADDMGCVPDCAFRPQPWWL